MKATGIVRRIDDLGRVVIPKEIRRTLYIREGDCLEIFREGDMVCFKKYDQYTPLKEQLTQVRSEIANLDYTSLQSKVLNSLDDAIRMLEDMGVK